MCSGQFKFVPLTFTLPREMSKLEECCAIAHEQYWIIKPASSSQGKGISITNKLAQIKQCLEEIQGNLIASHYISNPLLIDKLKFDLRIYVAVTSLEPLRIYVYQEGLTRFATTPYQPPNTSVNNREGKFCHLTNYSINKFNKSGFQQNNSAFDEASGSKWSLKALRNVLK